MCGRYYIDTDGNIAEMMKILEDIGRRFRGTPEYQSMRLGEIYPTYVVPVIANSKTMHTMPFLMKWGFSCPGRKGQLINARSETVLEKPTFRSAVLEHRCLIPAIQYFEWEKHSVQHTKYAIKTAGEPMIYMAGLYRYEESSKIPVFVILTREAAAEISFIHDRMPVILPREAQREWLSPQGDIRGILHEPAAHLVCQPYK